MEQLNGTQGKRERKEGSEHEAIPSLISFFVSFPTKVPFFQVTASLAEDESARIKSPFPGVTPDEVLDELNKISEYLSMK